MIVGAWQRSAIATLVERKTRLVRLVRLPGDPSTKTVGDALIGAFTGLPAPFRRTLTWAQGNEMFHHARIESQTGLRIHFADPHSPWQRGSNENTNGRLHAAIGRRHSVLTTRRARSGWGSRRTFPASDAAQAGAQVLGSMPTDD